MATYQSHSFKCGDVVSIFNCTMGGRFIIEGRATIVGIVEDVDEQYRVRFHGTDKTTRDAPLGDVYERFVDPDGQSNPTGHIARLNVRRAGVAS